MAVGRSDNPEGGKWYYKALKRRRFCFYSYQNQRGNCPPPLPSVPMALHSSPHSENCSEMMCCAVQGGCLPNAHCSKNIGFWYESAAQFYGLSKLVFVVHWIGCFYIPLTTLDSKILKWFVLKKWAEQIYVNDYLRSAKVIIYKYYKVNDYLSRAKVAIYSALEHSIKSCRTFKFTLSRCIWRQAKFVSRGPFKVGWTLLVFILRIRAIFRVFQGFFTPLHLPTKIGHSISCSAFYGI